MGEVKPLRFSKEIEKQLSEFEKISDFNYNKQTQDNYILDKIRYAPGFAKLYLHMCRSIKNRIMMFGAKEISEDLNIPLSSVYRMFKFLLERKEVKRNNLTSVTKYVVCVPLNEFVTERRVKAAMQQIK